MRQIETGHYPINFQTLPSSWAVVSVGEALSEIQPGFACGIHNRDGIGIPHIRPMNIDRTGRLDLAVLKYVSAENELRLHSGDVLFNNTNSAELIGKTTYIGIDAELAFSNHMTRLRPANGVDSRFIAYQLHFLWMMGYFQHRCTHHVNQASVASSTLADSVPLIIAPAMEQRHIVAEIEKQFTQLDAAVAALKRVRANLKRYRASVLKAACEGRLVPTEAELARREGRSYEPASVLLERILAERRARWEAEQKSKYKEPPQVSTDTLPGLPEGWTWASWEQLSPRVTVGHVGPMKDEYVSHGFPFLRSQNVRENKFDPEGLLHISKEFHRRLSKSLLCAGDLVVVRSGSVGTTCVVPDYLGEANCADLVIIKQPIQTNAWYGCYYMNSAARRYVHAGKVGVALIHFNTKSVAHLPVALPPRQEQDRIVAEVQRRLSVVDEIEMQVEADLKRAEGLRQSILRSAFEGKLVPQDPHDEAASVLLERIRGTAIPSCAPARAKGNTRNRRGPAPKETINA